MLKDLLHNKFFKKEIAILIVFYLTLIFSFVLGENSTGGAVLDYENQKKIVERFSLNFSETFLSYDNYSTRHSPILLIFLSFFEKINFSDFSIRLVHLHYSLLLPFVFFKCLKVRFKVKNENIFYLLTFLIFLSPTFRSLAIWPDSRISGLLFFTISLLFYLKFLETKKFNYALLNILSIAVSAYFSPNFSVFSIFFILNFVKYYKFQSKEFLLIVLINFFLAIPAIYYVFYLDINFLTKSAAVGIDSSERFFFNNIYNDILITFSIFFFYLLPFLISNIIKILNFKNIKNIFLTTIIFIICFINFDYDVSFTGGGIFLKFSHFVLNNNYFFYFISFVSILVILPYLIKKNSNLLLFILILLNNPQYTIYHKYFDPFLLIIFFTILNFNIDILKISKMRNYSFVFFYFFILLIISNLKFLWII